MPETRPSPNERRRLTEHADGCPNGHVTVMVDRRHIFIAASPDVLKTVLTVYCDEHLHPLAVTTNRHPLDTDTSLHIRVLPPLQAQIAANRLNVTRSRPSAGVPFPIPGVPARTLIGIDAAITASNTEATQAAQQLATDLDTATILRIFHPHPWGDLPDVEADLASDRTFTDTDQYRHHLHNLHRAALAATDTTTVTGVPVHDGTQRTGGGTVHPQRPHR